MLLIASIQHTGTWFIIDLIEKLTGERVMLVENALKELMDFDILHTHITTINYGLGNKKLSHMPFKILDTMIHAHKTIIHVRHPLLSIITRENRHPELNHYYIIEAFNYISTLTGNNIFFFPIDLYDNFSDRHRLLNDLCSFLSVKPEKSFKMKFTSKWKIKNSAADVTGLKHKFIKGDYKSIRKRLKEECFFLENRPEIHKFLKKLGYSNLIWQ